jgi:hypothetical protein
MHLISVSELALLVVKQNRIEGAELTATKQMRVLSLRSHVTCGELWIECLVQTPHYTLNTGPDCMTLLKNKRNLQSSC